MEHHSLCMTSMAELCFTERRHAADSGLPYRFLVSSKDQGTRVASEVRILEEYIHLHRLQSGHGTYLRIVGLWAGLLAQNLMNTNLLH